MSLRKEKLVLEGEGNGNFGSELNAAWKQESLLTRFLSGKYAGEEIVVGH